MSERPTLSDGELRRLAEADTPGPRADVVKGNTVKPQAMPCEGGISTTTGNAVYITDSGPVTVLSLLARAEKAEARNEMERSANNILIGERDAALARAEKAEAQVAKLRERLGEMKADGMLPGMSAEREGKDNEQLSDEVADWKARAEKAEARLAAMTWRSRATNYTYPTPIRSDDAGARVSECHKLLREALDEVRAHREHGASEELTTWCSYCRRMGGHTGRCLISRIAAELGGG